MIGINNRDLKTFVTELDVTLRLAPRVPPDKLVVAESGLSRRDDLGAAGEGRRHHVPDRRKPDAAKRRRGGDGGA